MKFVYATDLHGNHESYRGLFRIAEKEHVQNVIIGGDMMPNRFAVISNNSIFSSSYMYESVFRLENGNNLVDHGYIPIRVSRHLDVRGARAVTSSIPMDEFRSFQVEAANELVKNVINIASKSFELFVMPGNDDVKEVLQILTESGAHQMHGRCIQAGDTTITGYSFIKPSPFPLKDWEKTEDEIYHDLKKLARGFGENVILSTHSPPYMTDLDMLHNDEHVGSTAVRKFIEQYTPSISLHGHIHDSPESSGRIMTEIGTTKAFNPGSSDSKLRALLISERKWTAINV